MPLQLPVVHTTVFAAAPDGGNPCPVVFDDNNSLTTAQMQGLAARFGHETAFVLKPTQAQADLRLRYFVPNHEMEMCIHATVGTVTVLVEREIITKSPISIETPLGIIKADWTREDGIITVMVEQFPPVFAATNPTVAEVAQALGIAPTLIDTQVGPIQVVSTSRAKLMVPLRDFQVLDSLQPDFELLWTLCDRYRVTGFYPFTLHPRQPGFSVDARQFPLRAGYYEDPATGVAACALAAYLAQHQKGLDGWNGFQIAQGFAMSRPSTIRAEAYLESGKVTAVRVGGTALIMSDKLFSS
jgi:PhzF family phenazine biosynthesis protein